MESPYKDQYQFPVHQSTAHHGVGSRCHGTLLCSTTSEVCLLPISDDTIASAFF